jgi:phage shock protein PspC (stress-responsive transcriptional regulator)
MDPSDRQQDTNDERHDAPESGHAGQSAGGTSTGPQAPGPEDPTQPLGAPRPPQPRRLLRAREGRMIGGVCAGLGRYFNVDPAIFRVGAVALIFLGGAGLLLYVAGLLLIPSEPSVAGAPAPQELRGRSIALVVAGVVALLVVWPFLLGGGLLVAAILVPVAALAIAGVLVWWLVSGEGPSGDPPDIARRAALGIGVLLLCVLVAIGGGIAAAAGGEGVIAALLIGAGLAILGGAFLRPVRWLILPAVLLALSAGSVAAADVTLDGGVGERDYRPSSLADLRSHYQLGAGQLELDLSDVDLPPGDTPLKVDVGMGEAQILVPADVCLATDADIGMGEAKVLGRSSSGVDVTLSERPDAGARTSRLLLNADIGVGALDVRDTNDPPFEDHGFGRGFHDFDRDSDANRACSQGSHAR